MDYQVLYRKYRPKKFQEMLGQDLVVKTLKNQVKFKNIAHAYIFSGGRGTGKTTAAKIFAKAVNCLSPVEGDACNSCENCIELSQENNLDIIEMDAASNRRIEDVRRLIDQIDYPPTIGNYKVYILDEAHMFTSEASNALLKTLEEPPEHAVFILATTEPQKLISTVISRCQRFEFKRISVKDMSRELKKIIEDLGINAEDKALVKIAQRAEGSFRDALSLLDMCLGIGEDINEDLVDQITGSINTELLTSFAESIINQKPELAIKIIEDIVSRGKEIQNFTKDVTNYFRTILLAKNLGKNIIDLLEINEEEGHIYINQSEKISMNHLIYIAELFTDVEGKLRYSSFPKILIEITTIKACLAHKKRFNLNIEERVDNLEQTLQVLDSTAAIKAGKIRNVEDENISQQSLDRTKDIYEHVEKTVKEETRDIKIESTLPKSKNNYIETKDNIGGNKSSSTIKKGEKLNTTEKIWRVAIETIKNTRPGISRFLANGRFIGEKQGVFQVLFASANVFEANYLNEESTKKEIEDVLSKISNSDAKFEAILQSNIKEKEKENEQEKTIEQLYEDFGRENVQIDNE